MTRLASDLASRRKTNTAKAYILLDAAGGTSTTGGLLALAKANGCRSAASWNLASIFSRNPERVARMPDGWRLLADGYAYLQSQNHEPTSLGQAEPSIKTKSGRLDIVIGHGRSPLWKDLREWLQDGYDCTVHEFNSQSVAGVSTKERLEALLEVADVAILVMTAEDEQADGTVRARMNVVHEVGLFQGRLGFGNSPILLEDGCDEFSNIAGIGQIRFPRGDLNPAFRELAKFLKEKQDRLRV